MDGNFLFLLKIFVMTKLFSAIVLSSLLFQSCAQSPTKEVKKVISQPVTKIDFKMTDYLTDNKDLEKEVERIFKEMDDTARVAQLIMPAVGRLGKTKDQIDSYIKERLIGGVLMLNGTKDEFTTWIKDFENSNKKVGNLPFLYSADAEPSLVNRKITSSIQVKKANEVTNLAEVAAVAQTISTDLNAIGINYNFAPVVDMSANKTVGYRGFGAIAENLVPWSDEFIQVTQKNNIIATAKHFPGHGLVSGDTHHSLQSIDGEMKEVKNYPELIKNGVLSIMVAHIAVVNNPKFDTEGLPSTCSEKIVTNLLRDSLKFKGLIVTDAMNMGGVASVPQASFKAINAGCDILLMPLDVKKSHDELMAAYRKDKNFKRKADDSVKRIIRMKIAMGLIKEFEN
jgi:beta-N-acetylhexosaminidase